MARPYYARSTWLNYILPLDLNDRFLAIRPDTGATLELPILDSGNGPKVGECSIEAFTLLGGKFKPPNWPGKPNPDNTFPVLFLAFYKSRTRTFQQNLGEMATAPNAKELPALLAFLAQATTDALASGHLPARVGGEPFDDFDTWRKQSSSANPPLAVYNVVNQKLVAAGFKP
jgi:hypothetical protein